GMDELLEAGEDEESIIGEIGRLVDGLVMEIMATVGINGLVMEGAKKVVDESTVEGIAEEVVDEETKEDEA
ncbi:hypothetical protein KI387_025004, partial [Taxus chinensis]